MKEYGSISMEDEKGNGFGCYVNEKGFLFETQILVNGEFIESQITTDEAKELANWILNNVK